MHSFENSNESCPKDVFLAEKLKMLMQNMNQITTSINKIKLEENKKPISKLMSNEEQLNNLLQANDTFNQDVENSLKNITESFSFHGMDNPEEPQTYSKLNKNTNKNEDSNTIYGQPEINPVYDSENFEKEAKLRNFLENKQNVDNTKIKSKKSLKNDIATNNNMLKNQHIEDDFVQLGNTLKNDSKTAKLLQHTACVSVLGKNNSNGFEQIIKNLVLYKKKKIDEMTCYELENYHRIIEHKINKQLLNLKY